MIVIGSFVKAQEVDNPSKNTIEVQDSIQTDYKIKRISIGLGLGVPIFVLPQVQYTLPFLNNHLAAHFIYNFTGNYFYWEEGVEVIMKFSEFGVSYFFNEKGRGLYLGLGVSNLKIDAFIMTYRWTLEKMDLEVLT